MNIFHTNLNTMPCSENFRTWHCALTGKSPGKELVDYYCNPELIRYVVANATMA